ncbi:hypothetical protein IWQ57_001048 [Coemansia nantahalensis]|uniref:Uncharacterized protein n=1 Tax=Coemansia nantahalensis TaxID=2789366 RepID=A0ACC1K5Q2_9FUNG|nr:hypothetical protein IWQ57_001048 [Coemansia nantahalensis]
MSLFGDLPPLEPDDQGSGTAADAGAPPADDPGRRAWAGAGLTPNLRRPRPPVRPAAGSVVRPPVPAQNPKHPHAQPQDPAALMTQWATAAAAGEQPVEQQQQQQPAAGKLGGASAVTSLASFLPPRPHAKGRRRGPDEFDPEAEYDPGAPNSYEAYRAWTRAQRLARSQGCDSPGDGGERGDPGEPSLCVVLTNMVDAIDEDLERETADECSAFGTVVRCVAVEADDADGRLPPRERVRVVVEFADLDAAVRAQDSLDRRLFGGHHISAVFGPAPSGTAPNAGASPRT